MIRVILFSDQMSEVDSKINKYVNENLKVMIEVYRDYLYMNDGYTIEEKLSHAFPREFLKQGGDKFKDIIEELYEIISSPVIRYYMKPKYEASLYYIMEWWVSVQDYEYDYIPIKLDEELVNEINENEDYISENGTKIILEELKDIKSYFDFCFEDHDFLQDSVDSMVNLYLDEPKLVDLILGVNLDEYTELMSADMRESYIEKRDEDRKISSHLGKWSEEIIIKELYNCFKLLNEHVVEIREKSEVEISNEIFRIIKRLFKVQYGVEVERESEIGHSSKKLGENDFYIYQNLDEYINIAIGENKLLEGFNKAYGQVLGYLNYNFKFGFTISINKNKTIGEAYEYIINCLNNNKYEDFKIMGIYEEPFGKEYKYLVKSDHIIPEDITRQMSIYHLILDLNDKFRKSVAIKSRIGRKV